MTATSSSAIQLCPTPSAGVQTIAQKAVSRVRSNPAAPAMRPRSFRAAFGADRIRVCAQAWRNPVENTSGQTRGFTSFHISAKRLRHEAGRSSKTGLAETERFGFHRHRSDRGCWRTK